MSLSTRFTATQKQEVIAKFVNASGREVAIDGVPIWTAFDETVATVVPAPDGKSAFVRAGAPGVTTVTVTADARIGDGVVEISQTFDVEIGNDQAVTIVFEFRDPVDKD